MNQKLLIIVIALSMLNACQNPDERAEERENFGVELFKKGEYKKARLEFNSVLKEDGATRSNSNTYYYLALLNEKEKNFRAMKANLIKAVELDPKNIEARVKLGKVYLLFNEPDTALIEVDNILADSKDNIDGLLIKASAFIRQKKEGEALLIIEDILQKQPDQVEAVSLKAMLLMKNEQFDKALMLLAPLIDSGVDDISLHLLQIQLDAKKLNIDAIIIDYERLTKLYPDNHSFKVALAKIYSQANKKQEAEQLLRDVISLKPLKIKYKLILLDFLNSLGKEKLFAQIQKFETENTDKTDVLIKLSQWLISRLYIPEAQDLLLRIEGLVADSDSKLKQQQKVKLLLATIDFHENKLDFAKAKIVEIDSINPDNQQAKILRAKIYMVEEQYDEAVALLTKILWAKPKSVESIKLMAQIELLKGFPEKANQKFREVLKINPADKKSLGFVINRAIKNKEIEYASKLLAKAQKIQPKNLNLLKTFIELKMASGHWDEANELVATMENRSQGNGKLLAKFLRGKIHQEQGDCSKAIIIYKELLENSPAYPEALQYLATCYEIMKQRPQLISYLTSFLEKNPKNISAYLIIGELYSQNNNDEQALSIYKKILASNKKIPQIYLALARLYTKQGDDKKTIAIYKQGLEELPSSVRLAIYLALTYQKIKDYDNAVALYESLLAKNPRLEIAINNYAALLSDILGDQQSLEKARQLLKKFARSENPFYLDSFAWVELKLGNVKEALPLLEKVNVMAELAVFKYHLGVAYHKQGNDANAVAQLGQAIDLGKQKGGFAEIKQAEQLLDELLITP